MRLACLAALVVCLAGPAAAKGVAPGIYGDVRQSAATGDLGGAELEVIGRGASARVEFVYCEGWCNSVNRAPVTLTRNGFTFHYTEDLTDEHGRHFRSDRWDVDVTPAGTGLRISIRIAGRRVGTEHLKRLQAPFGLDVARHSR